MLTVSFFNFFSHYKFCDFSFMFVVSRAFLETKWSEHINQVTERKKTSTVSGHECHLWAGNLCCVDVVRKAVNASRFRGLAAMAVLGVVDLLFRRLFVYLVKGYGYFLSPVFGKQCRFYPTCSQYALDALNSKSFFKSLKLILLRISKCHPLHEGGYDPVK